MPGSCSSSSRTAAAASEVAGGPAPRVFGGSVNMPKRKPAIGGQQDGRAGSGADAGEEAADRREVGRLRGLGAVVGDGGRAVRAPELVELRAGHERGRGRL